MWSTFHITLFFNSILVHKFHLNYQRDAKVTNFMERPSDMRQSSLWPSRNWNRMLSCCHCDVIARNTDDAFGGGWHEKALYESHKNVKYFGFWSHISLWDIVRCFASVDDAGSQFQHLDSSWSLTHTGHMESITCLWGNPVSRRDLCTRLASFRYKDAIIWICGSWWTFNSTFVKDEACSKDRAFSLCPVF